jgi:hypothetical protein
VAGITLSYGACRPEIVGPVVGFAADVGAGVGRIDHLGLADDDPDMSDVGGVGAEEDEVAGLEWLAGRDGRTGVVLLLGCAWELDSGGGLGGLGEPGAVKASGLVAAPLVGGADLGERVADRDLCSRSLLSSALKRRRLLKCPRPDLSRDVCGERPRQEGGVDRPAGANLAEISRTVLFGPSERFI